MQKIILAVCWASLATIGTLTSGCATMFGSSSDQVQLDSEPSGASVYLEGNLIGKTPFTATIPKKMDATYLIFKKEGYGPKTINLRKGIEGIAFLNLFFLPTTLGATSWGVDALTGKMFRYNPSAYVIELDKKSAHGPQPSQSALEYVVIHHERLRTDISRSEGERLRSLCPLWDVPAPECDRWLERLQEDRMDLVSQPHGLALYRALQARL